MKWRRIGSLFFFLAAFAALYSFWALPAETPRQWLFASGITTVACLITLVILIQSAERSGSELQLPTTPDPSAEKQDCTIRPEEALELTDEDARRIDELVARGGSGLTRTEVIHDALFLFHAAFATHEADELIIMQNGEVVGRFRRAKSASPN